MAQNLVPRLPRDHPGRLNEAVLAVLAIFIWLFNNLKDWIRHDSNLLCNFWSRSTGVNNDPSLVVRISSKSQGGE